MSVYITMQGHIQFSSQADLDAAVKSLTDNGWIKDGRFTDEADEPYNDQPAADGLFLTFPYGLYRNIGTEVERLAKGNKGEIVWTCTDGMFQGGTIMDGVETLTDLEKWAKEEANAGDDDMVNPGATDFDAYAEWMQYVENAFMEQCT